MTGEHIVTPSPSFPPNATSLVFGWACTCGATSGDRTWPLSLEALVDAAETHPWPHPTPLCHCMHTEAKHGGTDGWCDRCACLGYRPEVVTP